MRKLSLTLLFVGIAISSIMAQVGPEISSWIRNTTGLTGYSSIPANVQTVQYDATYVYVSCSCVPGYSIGPWNHNPNVASNQNFTYKFPRSPQANSGTKTSVGLGHIGVWSNGVSIFNADDAMTYNNQGVWHRNADFWEASGFDNCLGHPQQQGEYHHHVSPTCLYNQADSTHHSPIIGYAFDGYPVYGAYAHSDTTLTSPIKRMASSYRIRNITDRTTLPGGATASSAGPAISSTYPLGAYIQDYEFIPGLGDLDSNNGRFCKTPEYPNGIYAYIVTIDASLTPVFPYTFINAYYGVVPAGSTGPSSGHSTIPGSTTVYTGSVGIDKVSPEIQFEFSPNPVTDYGYLYMGPESANNIKGTLYNSKGQLLETLNYLQPSMSYAIDFTKYPSGIYFLHFEGAEKSVIKKIIKAR